MGGAEPRSPAPLSGRQPELLLATTGPAGMPANHQPAGSGSGRLGASDSGAPNSQPTRLRRPDNQEEGCQP